MTAADEERRRFNAELGPQIAQTMRRPPSHGEQLAEAFDLGVCAGWELSGEGWNAEYPGEVDPRQLVANPFRMADEEVSDEGA